MSEQLPSTRTLRIAAISLLLSATYEVIRETVSPHISTWESRAVTVLFFTSSMFFLGRLVITRERKFLSAIRAREDFSGAVLENLPVVLCIIDAEGRFLLWNAQFENKLGYSKTDLSKIRVMETVAEEDRDRVQQTMETTFTENAAETEAFLVHNNGTKIPFYLTGSRIVFHGKPAILGIALDISAQRKANEELRVQATALRAAANGIVITRNDGTIEWVNPAFTKMTGFTVEESLGRNPRLLKSGRQSKEFYDGLWSTISAGKVWQGEIANCRKDGTLYTEEMTITPVVSESGAITHYIAIKQDVSDRKRAEEALQRAEEEYRGIFDQAIIGIFRTTRDGQFLMINPAMAKMLGCDSPEDAIAQIKDIGRLYGVHAKREELRKQLEANGRVQNFENDFVLRDGTELWLSLNVRCIYDQDGTPAYYEGTADDITERKLLERQLRQAQKMEAVGRLAGGVAHDFNNMLGVITGYSELLKLRTDIDSAAVHQIEQIHLAGKKASSLTQQLLAFSRKQIAQRQVLDLNQVVSKLTNMLRRLIGEDIELIVHFSCREARVDADASQMDQVIMNLAVNARDAMPGGGKLMIETDTCTLDESYTLRHRPVRPGPYVQLTISDTGCGMDKETMSHLFEPFFTTKELGRGTGLGLSIVYGIVKQSDGYIWAYSEPGQGTAFKIYLPLQQAKVEQEVAPSVNENMMGSENILVVEDNQDLRTMVVAFLKGLGYSVLQAEDGESALKITAGANTPIQVLITDIVMPKMSGRELANRLIAKLPNLRVLYTSGYTHDGVVQTRALGEGEAFLPKPFSLSDLSKKLRDVIEKAPLKRGEKKSAKAGATAE
jgi:PAS domain S-box-containing protein